MMVSISIIFERDFKTVSNHSQCNSNVMLKHVLPQPESSAETINFSLFLIVTLISTINLTIKNTSFFLANLSFIKTEAFLTVYDTLMLKFKIQLCFIVNVVIFVFLT